MTDEDALLQAITAAYYDDDIPSRELTTRITEYEAAYDAASPAAVDAVATAEGSDEQTIDDVYRGLADWATAREERDRYERARQQRTGSERDQASG